VLDEVRIFSEVNALAKHRGYSLFNTGAGLHWLVDERTRVPALNVTDNTLNFTLDQAREFLSEKRH